MKLTRKRTVRFEALARLARMNAGTEAQLNAKARALVELVELGEESPLSKRVLKRELQAVARTEAPTARGTDAVFTAIDGLDVLTGASGLPDLPSAADRLMEASWAALDDGDWRTSRRLRLRSRALTGN